MNRRQLIRRAGLVAAGFVASQVVEKLAVDRALEPAPVNPFVATSQPWPLFDRYASPSQRAALTAYREGVDLPRHIRALSSDQRFAVISFAGDAPIYTAIGSGLSVLSRSMIGAPVSECPNPTYGRFVYERTAEAMISGAPSYQSCFGRMDGRTVRYAALLIPCGDQVVSIGATTDATARAPIYREQAV